VYRDDHEAALQRIEALTDELARVVAERDALAAKTAELEGPASAALSTHERLLSVARSEQERLKQALEDRDHALAELRRDRDRLANQLARPTTAETGSMAIDTQRPCPKCSGRMEQGFIEKLFSTVSELQIPVVWVRGLPGPRVVSSDDAFPVGTFRCGACGFLESFARHDAVR